MYKDWLTKAADKYTKHKCQFGCCQPLLTNSCLFGGGDIYFSFAWNTLFQKNFVHRNTDSINKQNANAMRGRLKATPTLTQNWLLFQCHTTWFSSRSQLIKTVSLCNTKYVFLTKDQQRNGLNTVEKTKRQLLQTWSAHNKIACNGLIKKFNDK